MYLQQGSYTVWQYGCPHVGSSHPSSSMDVHIVSVVYGMRMH